MNEEQTPPTYPDKLPVGEGWSQQHEGERWSFDVGISLGDLIDLDGIDGLNDLFDSVLGVILTEIGYKPVEVLEDGSIMIRATGIVTEF